MKMNGMIIVVHVLLGVIYEIVLCKLHTIEVYISVCFIIHTTAVHKSVLHHLKLCILSCKDK